MKASELINELQKLISEHGDLPVNFDGGSDADYSIAIITAYDDAGNEPSASSPAIEFYLHQGSASSRPSPSTPS